jgi:anthranilate synthase component 1
VRSGGPWASNFAQAEHEASVNVAKEYIKAGDIFQVVLSQRLSRETEADPFTIYRALRMLNPSPYMYFLDFSGIAGVTGEPIRIIGSSPEMHVRLEDGTAFLHPIAGTRWRGATAEEDAALADDLMNDPKERAEHVMLVDLGRNDLGRVCEYGTVTVPTMMTVERYSHVMHIVSDVQGHIQPEHDAYSLLRATFPAGTVSGAPKVRAMEIIEELEGTRRGLYAGAVGYIANDGNMDTCIAIRTMVMRGQTCYLQAGGGIVADSDPTAEYQESLNKAKALAVAVEEAERGL